MNMQIEQILYKYGFKTKIKNEKFPLGINKKIIIILITKKNEPKFLKIFRLNAYKFWKKLNLPKWSNLNIKLLNYKKINIYSIPKKIKNDFKNKINPLILKTFQKLGISLDNKIQKLNIAIDAIFDSISIITTYTDLLSKIGIIFCSFSNAIKLYSKLIKKFLGSVISFRDNFYTALNTCVFSDGSFCYIPQHTICPLELSTYFRINNKKIGQFERTLIIVEKNSSINYLESCTSINLNKNILHAAIV